MNMIEKYRIQNASRVLHFIAFFFISTGVGMRIMDGGTIAAYALMTTGVLYSLACIEIMRDTDKLFKDCTK